MFSTVAIAVDISAAKVQENHPRGFDSCRLDSERRMTIKSVIEQPIEDPPDYQKYPDHSWTSFFQ